MKLLNIFILLTIATLITGCGDNIDKDALLSQLNSDKNLGFSHYCKKPEDLGLKVITPNFGYKNGKRIIRPYVALPIAEDYSSPKIKINDILGKLQANGYISSTPEIHQEGGFGNMNMYTSYLMNESLKTQFNSFRHLCLGKRIATGILNYSKPESKGYGVKERQTRVSYSYRVETNDVFKALELKNISDKNSDTLKMNASFIEKKNGWTLISKMNY